jgi:hypothetical protein
MYADFNKLKNGFKRLPDWSFRRGWLRKKIQRPFQNLQMQPTQGGSLL